jgi:hypothetical protein
MRKLAFSELPSPALMQKAGRPCGPRMPRSVAGAKMATDALIIIIIVPTGTQVSRDKELKKSGSISQDVRPISQPESRKLSVRKHKVIKKPYPTARTSRKTRSSRTHVHQKDHGSIKLRETLA